MKFLIPILLSACLASAATTYPLLSDTANARLVGGGATNIATLTGTNTFAGTNLFPAASFYIANGLGLRHLHTCPSNIYVASVSTVASGSTTNNGDYANVTQIYEVTLPALLSTNSSLYAVIMSETTNANTSFGFPIFYIGSNTNYLGTGGTLGANAGRSQNFGLNLPILVNAGSFTQQWAGSAFTTDPKIIFPTNFTDTSAPFKVYYGGRVASSTTNFWTKIRFYELVGD